MTKRTAKPATPAPAPILLDRETLLGRLTTLARKTIEVPQLGGSLKIRELTGRERVDANQAARTVSEDGDTFDSAFYNALVFVAGVEEPKLDMLDAQMLTEQGKGGVIYDVAVEILTLSEARATDMFPSNPAPDAAE